MNKSLLLLLILMAIPLLGNAEEYEICLISDNPDPVCFRLITDLPKEEIVAVAEYPNGDVAINIAGVDVNLRCKDTDGDGFDDECLMAVSAADSIYHANGAVLNAVCAGTTLIETVANGFGATYTRPTINAEMCGYVDPDPCFNGSWYVGWGNPECEDPNGEIQYRKVCPAGTGENYILLTPGSCL